MKVVVSDGRITLPHLKQSDRDSVILSGLLEGRKIWSKAGFVLEDSGQNRRAISQVFGEVIFLDHREVRPKKPARATYVEKTAPYKHQARALEKAQGKDNFALFMEQGTGKTLVAINRMGGLWCENEIDAVLILTKKGVHIQWVIEQLPEHLGYPVRDMYDAQYWKTGLKSVDHKLGLKDGRLKVFAMSLDSISKPAGMKALAWFVDHHKGRLMIIVDESQMIKNHRSNRTQACFDISSFACNRMILSGTPVSKDICDEWSQFKFLDERIIGVKYLTTFKNQFAIMGGFENRSVVGVRNLEDFRKRVDPYSFRVTKEDELDLPPKVYSIVPFEMSDEQRQHYKEMRDLFVTQLEDGTIVSAAIAAAALVRLQQITCGFLPAPSGEIKRFDQNPRLVALLDLLAQREGKAVIWARFREDINLIKETLGEKAVTYNGETLTADRQRAVSLFLDPNSGVDYFVSNPAAGGTGLNLQGDCRTNVYFSNSFNALDRWQSEDRTHRIGMKNTVTYFDLVCMGSPDRKILANLRKKKSISEMLIGEIKEMLNGIETN